MSTTAASSKKTQRCLHPSNKKSQTDSFKSICRNHTLRKRSPSFSRTGTRTRRRATPSPNFCVRKGCSEEKWETASVGYYTSNYVISQAYRVWGDWIHEFFPDDTWSSRASSWHMERQRVEFLLALVWRCWTNLIVFSKFFMVCIPLTYKDVMQSNYLWADYPIKFNFIGTRSEFTGSPSTPRWLIRYI